MSAGASGTPRGARSLARGVLYIATGAPFVAAARASAESVRRSDPELAIALFADPGSLADPRLGAVFDVVRPVAQPHRRSKVDYLGASPFERTLYLDADTRTVAPIGDVFDVLERFDVALNHAHARNRARTNEVWRTRLPASFPQFNGGVIAYRSSPEVLRFLDAWRDAFHSAGFRKDQVTLRELLWSSSLRIATLPPEYNLRRTAYLAFWRRREAAPRIFHLKSFSRAGARARCVEAAVRALAWRAWDARTGEAAAAPDPARERESRA